MSPDERERTRGGERRERERESRREAERGRERVAMVALALLASAAASGALVHGVWASPRAPARAHANLMAQRIVVTDGSNSFYNSRGVFQVLRGGGKRVGVQAKRVGRLSLIHI